MGVVDTVIRNGGQTSRVNCVSVRSDLPIDKQPQPVARRVLVRMYYTYVRTCVRACVRVSECVRRVNYDCIRWRSSCSLLVLFR